MGTQYTIGTHGKRFAVSRCSSVMHKGVTEILQRGAQLQQIAKQCFEVESKLWKYFAIFYTFISRLCCGHACTVRCQLKRDWSHLCFIRSFQHHVKSEYRVFSFDKNMINVVSFYEHCHYSYV